MFLFCFSCDANVANDSNQVSTIIKLFIRLMICIWKKPRERENVVATKMKNYNQNASELGGSTIWERESEREREREIHVFNLLTYDWWMLPPRLNVALYESHRSWPFITLLHLYFCNVTTFATFFSVCASVFEPKWLQRPHRSHTQKLILVSNAETFTKHFFTSKKANFTSAEKDEKSHCKFQIH